MVATSTEIHRSIYHAGKFGRGRNGAVYGGLVCPDIVFRDEMIAGDGIEADFRPPFCSIRLELTVVRRNLNHHLTDGTIAQMCQPVRRGKILDNLTVVVENASLHHALNR